MFLGRGMQQPFIHWAWYCDDTHYTELFCRLPPSISLSSVIQSVAGVASLWRREKPMFVQPSEEKNLLLHNPWTQHLLRLLLHICGRREREKKSVSLSLLSPTTETRQGTKEQRKWINIFVFFLLLQCKWWERCGLFSTFVTSEKMAALEIENFLELFIRIRRPLSFVESIKYDIILKFWSRK